MNKIWQKYLLIFVCFLITTNEITANPDTTKIPSLKLNNYRVKGLIRDLIKDGSIENDDVLLISFIEKNNEQYLTVALSDKNRLFLLPASLDVRNQKFIGYSTIFNHDCYVFSDRAGHFFTKKDSVQIPNYFDWLLSIDQMKIEDFLQRDTFEDSDGNFVEVPIYVQQRGALYKYVNNHFILIPNLQIMW